MHEHDLDLIAAYADGSLEGDPSQAERLVAECGTCRAEYELHRGVLAALTSLEPAVLTPRERSQLTEGVLDAVGLSAPKAPVIPLANRLRSRWMLAVASAAAVVLVGVGLVGALGQLGGQAGGEAFDIASGLGSEDAVEESATTAAATDDGMAGIAAEAAPEQSLRSVAPGIVELGEVDRSELASSVEQTLEASPYGDTLGEGPPDEALSLLSCEEQVDHPIEQVLTADVDGERVEVYIVGEPDGRRAVAFVAADCRSFELP